MGTRGLTAVYHDGSYRVAQYGQWDHDPDGQGLTVLDFCAANLATAEKRQAFAVCLNKVRFSTDEGELRSSAFASRDHGAGILKLIQEAQGEVVLFDRIDFAGESLHCEWAYVVDLDKATLEVFKGFNQTPLDLSERFAWAAKDASAAIMWRTVTYQPVRLVGSFSLDALPSEEEFLAKFATGDEEDE